MSDLVKIATAAGPGYVRRVSRTRGVWAITERRGEPTYESAGPHAVTHVPTGMLVHPWAGIDPGTAVRLLVALYDAEPAWNAAGEVVRMPRYLREVVAVVTQRSPPFHPYFGLARPLWVMPEVP